MWEIRDASYELAINRYKIAKSQQVAHEAPIEILARLRDLESEIADEIKALQELLQ